MSVSKEIIDQAYRLASIGAAKLNYAQKVELSKHLETVEGSRPYDNLSCDTCLRDALYQLHAICERNKKEPVLFKKPPTLFKGVKEYNYESMKYSELKKLCKEKGIKAGRVSKDELINLLKNK